MVSSHLPNLSASQVIALQDALLANADSLLGSARTIFGIGNLGLARSLAILAIEESGKAIALHERRVAMAYEPEGIPFVNDPLRRLFASHNAKLMTVHEFLVAENYWFGEPADPAANAALLGAINLWAADKNRSKQRGFYVDISPDGALLAPPDVDNVASFEEILDRVHQIGWQLRLGEHIEAKHQEEEARTVPPASDEERDALRMRFRRLSPELADRLVAAARRGRAGRDLNNDEYRFRLCEPDADPFENNVKPGYEAETRELLRLLDEYESD